MKRENSGRRPPHSITSSARARRFGGIGTPSALAGVFIPEDKTA
jgi:hypothetical protein